MSPTDFMSKILHSGSQSLLVPTMVCLTLIALLTVFVLGMLVVEYITERRHFKVNFRQVIVAMHDADYTNLRDVVLHANLLKRQVEALLSAVGNMGLPDDELFALAQLELRQAEKTYKRRVNVTDTIAKIAPMLGMMGTLIPLGPGIVAMGNQDVSALSGSMLIAFDTTVAGLVAAIIALVVSRVHRSWYAEYSATMQALMSCVLEEAARAREAGVELPYEPFNGLLEEAPAGSEVPAGPDSDGGEHR